MSPSDSSHHGVANLSNDSAVRKYGRSTDEDLRYLIDKEADAIKESVGNLDTVIAESLDELSTFEFWTCIRYDHPEVHFLIMSFLENHLEQVHSAECEDNITFLITTALSEKTQRLLLDSLVGENDAVLNNVVDFLIDFLLLLIGGLLGVEGCDRHFNKAHCEFHSSIKGPAFLPEVDDFVQFTFELSIERTVLSNIEIVNEVFEGEKHCNAPLI